jgi:archaellum component FlaF (FlaF/FlaG flagellin family)
MGFSVVFAVAIVGMVLILASGVILTGLAEFADEVSRENLRLLERIQAENETSLEIVNIEPVVGGGSSTLMYVEVLNKGNTSIRAAHFTGMDIILKYFLKADGSLKLLWLPYNPSGGENTWTVEEVNTGSTSGEILNPVRILTSSGQWDPDETMKIRIELAQSNAVDASPGKTIFILVSAPNGVKAVSSYVFS